MAVATVTLDGNTKVAVPPSLGAAVLAAQLLGESSVNCTQADLIDLLSNLDRHHYTQFVGITTDTEPRLKGGKKNPLVGLRKVSHYTARFREWKDAVNSQLKRDGIADADYQPSPPPGKEYVGDSPVMVGNTTNTAGTHYLAVIPLRGGSPNVRYYHPSLAGVDQERADEEVYRSPNSGAKQIRHGAEKPLAFRTPKVENIHTLSLGGFDFLIVG